MDIFQLLAEPTRRGILDLLKEGEKSVGVMAAQFPALSQPAISRHLRVLLDSGLVTVRIDAQRRMYSLQPGPLREVDAWLDGYRRLLDGKEN